MSKLEVEFAFEIGDIVYFKASIHTLTKIPQPFMVVERLAQQCPGGIQLQYRLGSFECPIWTNEIELSKEMPPYQRANPDRTADEIALRAARRSSEDEHWKAAIEAEKAAK